MLDPIQCRQRQQRLLAIMQQRRLDAVVVGSQQHVYYLSGHFARWAHQSAFALFADGRSVLVSANQPDTRAAADDARSYVANRFSTMRQEQPAACARQITAVLKDKSITRYAVDASAVTSQVILQNDGKPEMIDEELYQIRRCKDADELALMAKANDCTEAMYRRARQIIEPGIEELRVFGELHTAAVESAGEPLSAMLGNDYACGVAGGPARANRQAKAGELYILDLGPAYRGYFADNSRAISVDRKPTDAQMKCWQAIVGCFAIVESIAKPGVRCVEIFNAVDDHLKHQTGRGLPHHLGHGVGLQPHEYPHLNPKWDDTLVEGEIFTAEPGQYAPELAGGIRLENNYLVTPHGVKNLTPYPLERSW